MEPTLPVKPSLAKEYLIDILKANLVPMLYGSPGIGKSNLVHQICDEFNMALIDLRLSQCDPTDLLGFPAVNGDRAGYKPMDTFPLESDPLPDNKTGWVLFLDEMNSAPLSVQAAAYKLTLDRMVGQHHLHPNVLIVCAGNLKTDNAIVNRMSSATQSRMIDLFMEVDAEDWLKWAQSNDIDFRVTGYIGFRPSKLQDFDPINREGAYACPRTWAFLSKVITHWDELPITKLPLLAGTIGEGVAREFMNFCQIYQDLPSIEQIEKKPLEVTVPNDGGTLYAISSLLGEYVKESNTRPLLTYMKRLPREFQVVSLRDMCRRFPAIQKQEAFVEQVTELAALL